MTVDQVEAALSQLRCHEARAAVRSGVLTLVCVAPDEAGEHGSTPDQALAAVDGLGARHPARTVLIIPSGDDGPGSNGGGSGIDASASVHVAQVGERGVCYEKVVLHVRGKARFHLDSLIRPLTLSDLPVVIWTPIHLPAAGDPIVDVADRMLVDTRAAASGEAVLPDVGRLLRRLPVTDLSWVRLAPWRQLLAGLFQGKVNRPFLAGVDQVEVAGRAAPRHLLAGWLSSRLELGPDRIILEEATHVSICITAHSHGKRGEFAVSRPTDDEIIEARVDIEDGPSWTQTLRMQDHWPSRALADALTRIGGEDAYRDSVVAATRLMS